MVCFGKLAEVCGQYLCKAKQCYIEGSIRSRKWSDQNGEERKSFEIIVSQMRMLSNGNGGKGKAESTQTTPKAAPAKPVHPASEWDNPFEADDSERSF
jgi:single-strand DNA-binding protein